MKLITSLILLSLFSCTSTPIKIISTDCGYSVVTEDKAWDCLTSVEKDSILFHHTSEAIIMNIASY